MKRPHEIVVNVSGRAPDPATADAAREEVRFAAGRLFPGRAIEVSVLFCGDGRIRSLNRAYRGRDAVTDVLSFPMGEKDGGRLNIGDIVIARGRARADAVRDGMTIAEKLSELLTHGLLHLAGYDHETPGDARRMDARALSLRRARERKKPA